MVMLLSRAYWLQDVLLVYVVRHHTMVLVKLGPLGPKGLFLAYFSPLGSHYGDPKGLK